MIEDHHEVSRESHDGELLLYDYFKYLTSLVLITLGGLLLVMKDFNPKDVKPISVIITLVVVSSAGVISFVAAGEIADARVSNRPIRKYVRHLKQIAPALLCLGFGHFLAMFVDSLT